MVYTDPRCPIVDNIHCESNEQNLYLGPSPTYVSIVSSSLSCVGAASIIITYLVFKELRTTTRSIITFLAIADFTTALGYIVGGINYLVYSDNRGAECATFQNICAIQSSVTVWSQLSSFLWNCFLALFLYLMIVYGKHKLANHLITLFHIVAWVLPIGVTLPLLVTDHLGYSLYAASNWCFIKDKSYQEKQKLPLNEFVIALVVGKIPEIFSYAFMIVFYTLTRCFIKLRLRHDAGNLLKDSMKRIDQRLLVIPLVFILLRIWGTIQFFFTYILVEYYQLSDGCIQHKSLYYIHLLLGIMEAIGDGGQGWANALIFVYLNSRTRTLILRKVLYVAPILSCVVKCCRRKERDRYHDDKFESSISTVKYGSVSRSLPQVSGDTVTINDDGDSNAD